MEGSPAKKQKQTSPMAITPPPLKRSYAAVVRNNINSSQSLKELPACKKPQIVEKKAIIIEATDGNVSSSQAKTCHSHVQVSEDVHPYLKQLEQALELEVKYRVPVSQASTLQQNSDNNNGPESQGTTMSGGITSGNSLNLIP